MKRVVTAEDIEKIPPGQAVPIPEGAVLTPLAQDLLRKRGQHLVHLRERPREPAGVGLGQVPQPTQQRVTQEIPHQGRFELRRSILQKCRTAFLFLHCLGNGLIGLLLKLLRVEPRSLPQLPQLGAQPQDFSIFFAQTAKLIRIHYRLVRAFAQPLALCEFGRALLQLLVRGAQLNEASMTRPRKPEATHDQEEAKCFCFHGVGEVDSGASGGSRRRILFTEDDEATVDSDRGIARDPQVNGAKVNRLSETDPVGETVYFGVFKIQLPRLEMCGSLA